MNGGRRGLVLIVDDEPSNIEVLAEVLEGQYEIIFATSGPQALELAASARPDLILLDVMMPGMSGYEACTRLKHGPDTAGIPIIFVTALGDGPAETYGLELGAMDYFSKPINPAVVKVRVRNQVELKQARDELNRLATTDGLTGLANRRHFDNTLEVEYRRAARGNDFLSLILFDVDHFKAFNDSHGHVAGDECLRRIGGVALDTFNRASDTVARYGGEEFACILPGTDGEGAVTVAERLRAAIADLAIPHLKSTTAPHITISLGVVTARCVADRSPLPLLALADERLYAAKAGGRDRTQAGEAVDMSREPVGGRGAVGVEGSVHGA